MRCSIASTGLKSWGRAIHSLASIGDNDIHFEFTKDSLTLTTFDASLSVCATATFEKDFFMSYEILPESKLACRVPSKCILKPFRSMRFLTKPVSICEIGLAEGDDGGAGDKLEINIKCNYGASVRYLILLTTNAESLQVDYDMNLLKNCIQADAKIILTSLGNFTHSKGVADLTLKVSDNKILLKNSSTDLSKKDSSVHTEVMLNKVEFHEFIIALESELTFPMREFKCFANFAETMKLPMSINFHGSSEPVVVKVRGEEYYEASLTLATKLMGNENASCTPNQSQSSRASTGSGSTAGSISHVTSEPHSPPRRPVPLSRRLPKSTTQRKEPTPAPAPLPAVPFNEDEDEDDRFLASASVYFDEPVPQSPVFNFPVETEAPNAQPDDPTPNRNACTSKKPNGNLQNKHISSKPPIKRMKALFPNLGSTFEAAVDIPGHDVVLVENSDEDDYDEYIGQF